MPRTEKFWTTDFNFTDEVLSQINPPQRVIISDCTLREGDQTPGCVFTAEEKVNLAKDLDDLGVDHIQLFAMVSQADRDALKAISAPGFLKHASLNSLARLSERDIESAAETGVKRIALEGPGNIEVAKFMGFSSHEEILQKFVDCIKFAKSLGLEAGGGVWDMARGMGMDFFERFIKEIANAGIDMVCYADTYGFTMPWTVVQIVSKMRAWIGPDVDLACHFHNDFGLATANSLAAVAGGANAIDVCMNGLGERVGNAPLDEIAVNLALNMNVKTDIKLEKIYPLAKKIEAISKVPLPANKPISGERCFTLGSGITVDMLQKAIQLGDITKACSFDPSLVGRPPFNTVFGKGVGANMVLRRAEASGYNCSKAQAAGIAELIKKESIEIKGLLPDWRVDQIIRTELGN